MSRKQEQLSIAMRDDGFKTHGFYFACFLRCTGYELLDLRAEGGRKVSPFATDHLGVRTCCRFAVTFNDEGAAMTDETIVKGLGDWKVGQGWTARCPAHDDRDPSISIRDADGRVLDLPGAVCEVIVLADGGDPGDAATRACAERWMMQGRRVRLVRLPRGMDFNDVLLGRGPDIEGGAAMTYEIQNEDLNSIFDAIDRAEEILDPLDGLVEKSAKDPGAAFTPEVLARLVALKREDRAAFETLRTRLKKAGCRVTALDEAMAEKTGDGGRRPEQANAAGIQPLPVHEEGRRPEAGLWMVFKAKCQRIFSALLDALLCVLLTEVIKGLISLL